MANENEKKQELQKGDKVVNLFKRTTLVATKENRYYKEGTEFKAQENIAKYLVEKGYAKNK